jgi:ureidoacrylate peracid hydrolase
MEVQAGIEVLTSLEERVDPRHTAVIVVDMQNDYCSPGGASDRNGRDISAIPRIVGPMHLLVERAHELNLPVVYTKYSVGPGNAGLSGPEILRRGLNFAGVQATIKGTWGHEIIADLPFDAERDLVVEKRRLSSFVGTDLDMYLRANRIKTIVIVGVVTQGCVECTARDAASYDYYVAVAADCVASTTEADHERGLTSMATLLRYQDAVTTSGAILDVWSKG